MSYDLQLFRVSTGSDPMAVQAALVDFEESQIEFEEAAEPDASAPSPPPGLVPFAADDRERIAEAAVAALATLVRFTIDDELPNFVELNDEAGGTGLQIRLGEWSGGIHLPYWHEQEAATAVIEQLRPLLRAMRAAVPFAVFDPQLDQVLDPDLGFETVYEAYSSGSNAVSSITADVAERAMPRQPRRPWWKFW